MMQQRAEIEPACLCARSRVAIIRIPSGSPALNLRRPSAHLMPEQSNGILLIEAPGLARGRWSLALVLGTALALVALIASELVTGLVLGFPVEGIDVALVGLLRILLVPLAIWIGLRPVGIGFRQLGLRGPRVGVDALAGLAVASGFALLQFGVIIPMTGGAARSDLVVESARIGDTWTGVAGFLILALTGAPAEEVLFRGHILTTLRNAFGPTRWSLPTASAIIILAFGFLHGYQGWAGVVDTGLYGGLVLTVLFLWRGGRLTAPIVAHAGWNVLATIGIYLWY